MNINFIKKALLSFVLLSAIALNAFAVNAADSDLSNSAGSNSGKNHMGMYIAICLFLVLAAAIPFFGKRRNS